MSLGRGLGALISSTSNKQSSTALNSAPIKTEGQVWQVPISEIETNPKQPRKYFSPVEIEELANSIKEHGVLQPLLVAEKVNGKYELVAGERRLRASKLAGLVNVPVMIKKLAEQEKLEVSLIENIQRQDLNPIEEAFAYKRLTEEFSLTQQAVADKVGKSRPAVANTIRLLDLPSEIQEALIEKRINTGQARSLLGIAEKEQQLAMLASMLGQKITVREMEREVNKQRTKGVMRRDPNLLSLEDRLRRALGTKVSITNKGEKGTILINYYSKEEFNRLIDKMSESEN